VLGEEIMGEANLSAQEAQAHAHARFPGAHVDASRSRGYQEPPGQGPSRPHCLTWRVRDRATFVALGGAPRRRRGALSLAYVPGPDPNQPPRVAFAIGKRVGGAVIRNRVRRRLREAVLHQSCRLRPGGAYLIGASPAAAAAKFGELEASLAGLLRP
jgi:ribonuclease P protein component